MKKQGHPAYHQVLFTDITNGHSFVCGTTLQRKERASFEGQEYPVFKVSTSSASHPFFTKSERLVDAEGRVNRFVKRYAKKATPEAAPAPAPAAKHKKK